MPADAVGIGGTLYTCPNRVRIAAGEHEATHPRILLLEFPAARLPGGPTPRLRARRHRRVAVPLAVAKVETLLRTYLDQRISFHTMRSTDRLAFLVVPVAISVRSFLIADLDRPRGGAIRVAPVILLAFSQPLPA